MAKPDFLPRTFQFLKAHNLAFGFTTDNEGNDIVPKNLPVQLNTIIKVLASEITSPNNRGGVLLGLQPDRKLDDNDLEGVKDVQVKNLLKEIDSSDYIKKIFLYNADKAEDLKNLLQNTNERKAVLKELLSSKGGCLNSFDNIALKCICHLYENQ